MGVQCEGLSSREVWSALSSALREGKKQRLLDELTVELAYPRLDINVSKQMNHLLKAPFCVHPKTGKVCVPIAPERASEFDPDSVPTLRELVAEINESRTPSLEPHVKSFKQFTDQCILGVSQMRGAEADASMEF